RRLLPRTARAARQGPPQRPGGRADVAAAVAGARAARQAVMAAQATDAGHMARAIELARRGLFSTDPNPRVGCVIADGERVIAEGWHEQAGGPHAEAAALAIAGTAARGATAYVTLEPCCHHGRTPPCADALIAAGLRRVCYAIDDPNPRVSGGDATK